MSKTNFTAGKWRAIEKKNSFIIENDEETYIADVHFWSEGAASVTKANAHLIAAAPCLFESLSWAMKRIDKLGRHGALEGDAELYEFAKALSALKKARGEHE